MMKRLMSLLLAGILIFSLVPAQVLAMLCYLVSALAFCAGCWLATGQGTTDAASQMTTYARR